LLVVHEDEALYGIEELADRAGVSRRTVRYYVQRGLLPAPTGVGRGKHYTEAHLARLVRVRELQEQGVALADIAARLEGRVPVVPAAVQSAAAQSTWTHVAISDGVELMVRGRRLDEAELRRVRAAVERALAPRGEEDGR
jgi:DNA-binding transcriptional MerR regulator